MYIVVVQRMIECSCTPIVLSFLGPKTRPFVQAARNLDSTTSEIVAALSDRRSRGETEGQGHEYDKRLRC